MYERFRFLGFARNDIWGGLGMTGVWWVPAFAGKTEVGDVWGRGGRSPVDGVTSLSGL